MILAVPYRSARQALAAREVGEVVILLDGMPLIIDKESAIALAADGTDFAYLTEHRPSGRIMTIPVN
jgi:hypothetical protein